MRAKSSKNGMSGGLEMTEMTVEEVHTDRKSVV